MNIFKFQKNEKEHGSSGQDHPVDHCCGNCGTLLHEYFNRNIGYRFAGGSRYFFAYQYFWTLPALSSFKDQNLKKETGRKLK